MTTQQQGRRLVLTGGAGYIGSHVAHAASDAGAAVLVIDDLSVGLASNLPRGVELVVGDAGDPALLDRVFASFHPDSIVHLSGIASVPESVEHPTRYYRRNTAASLAVIEACLKHGVRQFIFSSSAAVYGTPETAIVSEDAETRPISPYGSSKLMTERMLADIAVRNGMSAAALRYFNVAGADERGRTGECAPQGAHLIKVACEVAVGLRDCLLVHGIDYPTDDGTCVRDYIHVTDVAEAHLAVLDFLARDRQFAVFNCGLGQGTSVRQVIAALERVLGRRLPVRDADRRPGDPPVLVSNSSRLSVAVGWNARHSDLDFIIRTALAWEQRRAAQPGILAQCRP